MPTKTTSQKSGTVPGSEEKSPVGSGGDPSLERDGVAEAFELGDEASGLSFGVAARVEVGAGVAVGLAGLEHVPGGGEHRVGDRGGGLVVSAAGAQALVLRGGGGGGGGAGGRRGR